MFCEAGSTYNDLDAEVWGIERDAMTWEGGRPAIYHPPCRLWGQLRQFSTAPACERLTGIWAIHMVSQFGGVLEHPVGSTLFNEIPKNYPGFMSVINQCWFGHPFRKRTKLYVNGLSMGEYGELIKPFVGSRYPSKRLENSSRKWRTKTPVDLAKFLIEICKRIENPNHTS